MDIAILNYPTGQVDVLRGVDEDFLSDIFADEVECYLESQGYNINDIHYMCADELTINDPHEF